MQARNAANVFPETVGAKISVVSPAKICGQPCSWGSVGVPNRLTNQSRTSGCAQSRPGAMFCALSVFIEDTQIISDRRARGHAHTFRGPVRCKQSASEPEPALSVNHSCLSSRSRSPREPADISNQNRVDLSPVLKGAACGKP